MKPEEGDTVTIIDLAGERLPATVQDTLSTQFTATLDDGTLVFRFYNDKGLSWDA